MNKKISCLIVGLFILTISVTSQAKPCSDSMCRQFDFWIGEWEAFDNNQKKAGDSKITAILDGCFILEEWTSATVNKGIRYAGKSYNHYNAAQKKWQQYWVDNSGTATEYFNGHYEPGKMILETANENQADGSMKIQRMTFYHLGTDIVRQHGENSTDNGKTWKTDFDFEYRRKK